MLALKDYDYDLPEAMIAQAPASPRDQSRLLCLDRKTGRMTHHRFYEILDRLKPTDVLVINDTRVIPARLFGKKGSGGKVEVLLLDSAAPPQKDQKRTLALYDCLVKASKRPKPGQTLFFDAGLKGEVLDVSDTNVRIRFDCVGDFEALLERIGHTPLPPYIKRPGDRAAQEDRNAYQTVYAQNRGAVAAPTAGLHFTEALLEKIKKKGVTLAPITLHVGHGTFLPVRSGDIRKHKMHAEQYAISEQSSRVINSAKKEGRRIVAVGTTCVRTLEYAADDQGRVRAGADACDLFIFPGFRFRIVDALLTNFHLPQSTLIMLVAAFCGREQILAAYRETIACNYRFYSYGDAMLIE